MHNLGFLFYTGKVNRIWRNEDGTEKELCWVSMILLYVRMMQWSSPSNYLFAPQDGTTNMLKRTWVPKVNDELVNKSFKKIVEWTVEKGWDCGRRVFTAYSIRRSALQWDLRSGRLPVHIKAWSTHVEDKHFQKYVTEANERAYSAKEMWGYDPEGMMWPWKASMTRQIRGNERSGPSASIRGGAGVRGARSAGAKRRKTTITIED